MLSLLHNFQPAAVLAAYGPLTIYWYGLFMVLAILAAMSLTLWLAKHYQINGEVIFDLSFWLIIGGLAGARIYDDLLQLPYYWQHPWQSLAIWRGGLAIHGAIIAGALIIWLFARRRRLNFWRLGALIAPGLALGQAIGRWGNYFNQEIFGLPSDLPWSIPIDIINRPAQFIGRTHFHPTFLYESLGCLLIGLVLIAGHFYRLKNQRLDYYFDVLAVALYMILYSILRFGLEFIRLDPAPAWLGWRWPQIASLMLIAAASLLIVYYPYARLNQRNEKK
ncbi:MAG: prolipoprotein diacylglyceryl transferase [Patescibacteria group bacterium]